jgi:16S rRNA A1518/A1519 N6-dimethyltransferase RsmA/KsgA/DIM1 with predicted DNA glycosylase/AP lyase activity
VVLVENSPACCRELYEATERDDRAKLYQGDFLTHEGGPYPAVLMNPPYRRGSDVRHIVHARTLLEPGGTIVALCYDGAAQRRHLEPIASTWEPLGPGLFKSEGTRAACVLLTITT